MAENERKDVAADGEVTLSATRTHAVTPPDRVPSRVSVAERITCRGVFRAAIRALIDLDFTSLRTVMELARRPGALVLGYIEGDCNRVMNPIKFAVLTSTLYVLVNSLTTASDAGAMIDPLMSLRGLWPYLSLVILFPAAALQRLFFSRRRLDPWLWQWRSFCMHSSGSGLPTLASCDSCGDASAIHTGTSA